MLLDIENPDYKDRVCFYDDCILDERGSIYFAMGLAGAVITCGISSAVLIYIFAPDGGKMIGTMGSALMTLLSGLPLKDYPTQKTKIKTYKDLQSRYKTILEHPEKARGTDFEKLEELTWKLHNKRAGVGS